MSQDSLNKRQGYTLIEIIMSMLFFGIIVLGLSLPYSQSMSLSVKDQQAVKANNLAKLYLKDLEYSWEQQNNYDTAALLPVDDTYTDSGNFVVSVTVQNIANNSEGIEIIRRVKVEYQTQAGDELMEVFLDYNRPGL